MYYFQYYVPQPPYDSLQGDSPASSSSSSQASKKQPRSSDQQAPIPPPPSASIVASSSSRSGGSTSRSGTLKRVAFKDEQTVHEDDGASSTRYIPIHSNVNKQLSLTVLPTLTNQLNLNKEVNVYILQIFECEKNLLKLVTNPLYYLRDITRAYCRMIYQEPLLTMSVIIVPQDMTSHCIKNRFRP